LWAAMRAISTARAGGIVSVDPGAALWYNG